jgi:hypothetical protein
MVERLKKGPKDNGDFFIRSFLLFPWSGTRRRIREAEEVPKVNGDCFTRSFFFHALVRYQKEEVERMKRNQRSTMTSLVGLIYYYSLVR